MNPLTSLVNTSDVCHFDDSLLAIHCIHRWSGRNEEGIRLWLQQMEQILGQLWHRYSLTVNLVNVSLKLLSHNKPFTTYITFISDYLISCMCFNEYLEVLIMNEIYITFIRFMIKFVSDLLGFLRVLRFHPPIKLAAMI